MPGDSTGQGTPLPIASGRGDTAQHPWAAARIGPFHDCPHKGQRTREQGGQQGTSLSLRHPPRIASHHQKPGLDQNPPHFLGTRGMEQQRHQRDSEGTARGPPPKVTRVPKAAPRVPRAPQGCPSTGVGAPGSRRQVWVGVPGGVTSPCPQTSYVVPPPQAARGAQCPPQAPQSP